MAATIQREREIEIKRIKEAKMTAKEEVRRRESSENTSNQQVSSRFSKLCLKPEGIRQERETHEMSQPFGKSLSWSYRLTH